MVTEEELRSFFDNVDESKKQLAYDTIREYVFFRNQIADLSLLPTIQTKKSNPAIQRITQAGKLIKDYSQVLDAKRGTLLRILNHAEGSAADELLERLAEFE